MTHDETITRLDEFLSGELSEGEAREVRAHLAECVECRDELAWLRSLREEVRALPAGIAPPRDLWSGIAERLTPPDAVAPPPLPRGGEVRPAATEVPGVIPLRPRAPRRPRWPLAAAAMIAVALGSSTLTYVLVGPGAQAAVTAPDPAPTSPVPPEARPRTALAAFAPAETEYRLAVDELAAVLESRRDELAPETVATLERNLAIIDEAIRQSRAALEADPNSAKIAQMLTYAYDAKVETLRQAVSL